MDQDSSLVRIESVKAVCRTALYLVKALVARETRELRGLWLVTRGAQQVSGFSRPISVAQAPLWGFGRTVALEHPELNCMLVDLDPSEQAHEVSSLVEALSSREQENQVAWRERSRHIARLVRIPESPDHEKVDGLGHQAIQVVNATPGLLDGIALRPATRRRPGRGEVEICVHVTGLNFRDVLMAMGVYPGEADPLGIECAGRIESVGEGVEHFQVGDEVIAIADGCFSTFAVTDARLVALKPKRLNFDEAATIPGAFLTADYTLHKIAAIAASERILIHAAAGGVGMAAIQLARRAGAEVFATAGSPQKRDYLKSLGIQHVFDSRSLEFASEVMALTHGRGVDVVLNSLAGDFIPK